MTEHTDTPVSAQPQSEPTPPPADSSPSATSRPEDLGSAEDAAVPADATSSADNSAAAAPGEEAPAAATPATSAADGSAAADEEATRDGVDAAPAKDTPPAKGSANGSAGAGAVTAAAGRVRPAATVPAARAVEATLGVAGGTVDGSAEGATDGDDAVEGSGARSASASDAVHASDAGDASAENVPTHDATPVADNTVSEFTPEFLEDAEFRSALEAMLLVVDAPAPVEQLAAALDDTTERVEGVLRELSAELSARGSGIDLRFVGDGWRFYTRSEYAPYVERVLLDGARTKLTRAALETLAVVAYRQPVTRTRVSAVRGVNVDGVMRTLLARGLIAEAGVDPETNGTTYSTTELFLERIGLASLTDLPPLAPLLPGVDLIDEINESLDTDPRYTKLKKPAEADLDLGSED
ncbi:hypothetical protein NBRGN_099_00400 [Nocardia brasiliensis NBRC 14402]|nr:hypothetical protein NBRGN_099_00400 [Nocardia brasiliensis NBRC 14402]SUB40961.1 Segregation and condensation protein B [Nocardia brasiliensis]